MGTSKNPKELATKFEKLALTIPDAHREGVKEGVQLGKQLIIRKATERGVPITAKLATRPWSVGYDLNTDRANPTAFLRIKGAFPLVESDIDPHMIQPKKKKKNSARRQIAISFPGIGPVRGGETNRVAARFANHPGTRGKHIFRDAKAQIKAQVPPVVFEKSRRSIVKTFL